MDISDLPDEEALELPRLTPAEPARLSAVIGSEAEAYRFITRKGGELSQVPEDYRSENVCAAAVHRSGAELRHVPDEHKSYWMCSDAVESNGLALAWVPEEHRDYAMCLLAVDSHGMALDYVPEEFQTEELLAVAADALQEQSRAAMPPPAPTKPARAGLQLVVNNEANQATDNQETEAEEDFDFAGALQDAAHQAEAQKAQEQHRDR